MDDTNVEMKDDDRTFIANVALAASIAVRESLADAMEFADRSICYFRAFRQMQFARQLGQKIDRAKYLSDLVMLLRQGGHTWGRIAEELNRHGLTNGSRRWTARQIRQLASSRKCDDERKD